MWNNIVIFKIIYIIYMYLKALWELPPVSIKLPSPRIPSPKKMTLTLTLTRLYCCLGSGRPSLLHMGRPRRHPCSHCTGRGHNASKVSPCHSSNFLFADRVVSQTVLRGQSHPGHTSRLLQGSREWNNFHNNIKFTIGLIFNFFYLGRKQEDLEKTHVVTGTT